MNAKQLLAMASRRQWMEASTLLARPENHCLASELMPQLEALGDQAAASRCWVDSANHYQAAILCATLRKQDPNVHEPLFRLGGKLNASMREFMEEHIRDETGAFDWTTGTNRVIELALMRRLQEADALLQRLGRLDDPDHQGRRLCGRRMEQEANQLPGKQRDLVKWFCERALSQLRKAKSTVDIERLEARFAPPAPARKAVPPRPPAPPPVDLDDLVAELAGLARDRRRGEWHRVLRTAPHKPLGSAISQRFEALADACRQQREWFPASEFYSIAATAGEHAEADARRLGEKIQQMTLATIDEKVSRPLLDTPPPEPSDWDHGWDVAESLALAGRFAEADALLIRLEGVRDDYSDRGFELPGRFEAIGDYLLTKHPELARWFYERFQEEANNLPADCAYEGYVRRGVFETAAYKVAQANARIPRRVATVQVALGAMGQGPRPEPEVDVVRLENDQVLKLVPLRGLFTRRPCRGGSEPIPPESLHRYYFRIRIEGQELRLFPERDEYGHIQAFAFEPPPLASAHGGETLFRLQADKPVVVSYNVPGGGPAWTLTLTGIASA